MTDKPYVEKLGGSYVVDPKTRAAKRIEGTEEPTGAAQRPADKAVPAALETPNEADPAAKKGK